MLAIFAALSIGAAMSAGAPVAAKKPQTPARPHFTLTVLHNNDAESQLIDAGTGLEDFGGAARATTLADNLKAAATRGPGPGGKRGVVMLSSGDNFLAGPEFNASLEKGPPFYDAIAMEHIGYDAVAIGNHEFDFGPDVLADFIGSFSDGTPFLSANLDVSGEPTLAALEAEGRIAESVVIRERGERIGIIGATTPRLPSISSPRNVVVHEDVAGEIQEEVDELEGQGVGIIILIAHLQSIQEDLDLAPMLSGVDIMIAGGGDELLANPGDLLVPDGSPIFGPYPLFATDGDGKQVPVITTNGAYRYFGRLVAQFDRHGEMVGVNGGPVRVSGVPPDAVAPDPQVLAEVTEPVQEAIAALAENVVANSEVDLDGVRARIRTEETNEGNLIADSLLDRARSLAPAFGAPQADVALQNGGGIRNDSIIPAGPITELDTFDMVPFTNFLSVVPDVPRSQFKELLENAVSRVEFGDGRFAQIAGFSFVWDDGGTPQVVDNDGNVLTPGTRVVSATLDDGTPIISGGAVVAGPALNIATIDFLARGGDQYPYRGASFTTLGEVYQQSLEAYLTTTLAGQITAADYPFGGEGRITRI
ncbi:MAG TPA: 5'-nucleotidase C-terminal domain-containing protein [Actinomycetota bacterium]|nr:5'-nucleotidase C-terminal domain-containing protein [Actinomycetota bacterium]